jgi:TMEM175 potassium channel family protein
MEGAAPVETPGSDIRLSSTGRVEAFSDGVMAIAITLLVLDLRVPSAEETAAAGSLLAALLNHWASDVAFLAGFLTIGIIWLNHRAFVDKVNRFDNRLQWLNLLLLLGVVIVPFTTALLAEYVGAGGTPASTATAVYALSGVVLPVPWILIWRHLSRHPELLQRGFDAAHARAEFTRALVGPAIYILAIPVAILAPIVALLLFIGIAVLYALTNQGVGTGPGEPRAGGSA